MIIIYGTTFGFLIGLGVVIKKDNYIDGFVLAAK